MWIVLPYCNADKHLALLNLELAQKLDGQQKRTLLLACASDTDRSEVADAARGAFTDVHEFVYMPCPQGTAFPRGCNWAWQSTARHIEQLPNARHWLWWEPDAVPTKSGWVDALDAAYTAGKKPFAGCPTRNELGQHYIVGVAIYPARCSEYLYSALLTLAAPWDVAAGVLDGMVRQATDISHLLLHNYRADGEGDSFTSVDGIPASVVLYHRCNDGSLQSALAAPPPPPIKAEPVTDITVVITNFKRPEWLQSAFDSCKAVGVPHLVVSSSGTTREVAAIHKQIRKAMPRAVITSRKDDGGCNENWMRGVEAARTKRVHILHDDDRLLPAYSNVLDGRVRGDIIHTDGAKHSPVHTLEGTYVTRDDLPEGEWPLTYLLPFLLNPRGFTLSPVSGIFPREHVLDVLRECEEKFDERFYLRPTMLVGNDLLLWLRACQKYSTFYYTHQPFISYGHWRESASFDDVSNEKYGLLPIYKATRAYYLRTSPRILHVVQRYPITDAGDRRRYTQAAETWELGYANGLVYPRHQWVWDRDSSAWKDKRQVPFLRDVLERALDEADAQDVVCLTNDDTLINQYLWYHALHMLKTMGACTSFRINVPNAATVDYRRYPRQISGRRHCGRDAFFFTRKWLKENLRHLPDYVMTYCDWDSTLDMQVRLSHGHKPEEAEFLHEHPSSNIPSRFVYHEMHDAFWSTGQVRHTHPCNIRCRELTDTWFAENLGWPMPDLTPT